MHIRDATESDLPDLLEIHNHAVRNLDAIWIEREDTPQERAQWFTDRTKAGLPIVVAVDEEDNVLGYGSYGTYRAREGYRATVEHSVYLYEHARGHGAGKALLIWLIERARRDGYHAMVAVVDASNLISIRLHERLGFQSSGILRQVGQKKGRWLDQQQLVLLLDDRKTPAG